MIPRITALAGMFLAISAAMLAGGATDLSIAAALAATICAALGIAWHGIDTALYRARAGGRVEWMVWHHRREHLQRLWSAHLAAGGKPYDFVAH